MMKFPKLALTMLALAAILSTPGVRADVTVVCNTDPIIFGTTADFQLKGTYLSGYSLSGDPSWETKWVVGACNTGFKPDTNHGTIATIKLLYPGTLTVRCTAVYKDGPGGHTVTLKPTKTITVPPPDGAKVIKGDKVSVRFGQVNPTTYQVTCKGKDSIFFTGFAQEKITKFKYLTTGKTLPDMDWVPKIRNGEGSNVFYLSTYGKIEDVKSLPMLAVFKPLPANTPLLSCHQGLRVSIVDPCGNLMDPIELGGGFDITETKDAQNYMGGTYIIIHELSGP